MKHLFFVSCWGNEVDALGALDLMRAWSADGVEGPPPADDRNREALCAARRDGKPWIAEVVTGGGYIPRPRLQPAEHLDDLRRGIDASAPYTPLTVNALAGSDAWAFRDQVKFFESAIQIAAERGTNMLFETHRTRPTFHPWRTRDLLRELPHMRLTCDFSHWCTVCERLVMDEEPELLDLFAKHAGHVHARCGYDQGPQVPDPRAPEYAACISAHARWWQHILRTQSSMGATRFTFTPEFGPDGYLHCEPGTKRPVADLREVNHWMMRHLRDVMA
jgi:hypothetical protein